MGLLKKPRACADEAFDPFSDVQMATLRLRERAEMLRHCKWVDQVVAAPKDAISTNFLSKHKIHYVANFEHKDLVGYTSAEDRFYHVKKMHMFIPLSITEDVKSDALHNNSHSKKIIKTILHDYLEHLEHRLGEYKAEAAPSSPPIDSWKQYRDHHVSQQPLPKGAHHSSDSLNIQYNMRAIRVVQRIEFRLESFVRDIMRRLGFDNRPTTDTHPKPRQIPQIQQDDHAFS